MANLPFEDHYGHSGGWCPCRSASQLSRQCEVNFVVDDLAVRSTQLEAAGQWPELVSLCETAARKGNLSNELYQRYDLAKIHCDLDRRSAEKAYQEALRHITEGEARQLFVECLGRINSHHVTNPDFHKLISRGCLALQVAISDPRISVRACTSGDT